MVHVSRTYIIILQYLVHIYPSTYLSIYLASGYLTVRHGKSPFLSSVNHLFLWAIYTMAMLVITRWYSFDVNGGPELIQAFGLVPKPPRTQGMLTLGGSKGVNRWFVFL